MYYFQFFDARTNDSYACGAVCPINGNWVLKVFNVYDVSERNLIVLLWIMRPFSENNVLYANVCITTSNIK